MGDLLAITAKGPPVFGVLRAQLFPPYGKRDDATPREGFFATFVVLITQNYLLTGRAADSQLKFLSQATFKEDKETDPPDHTQHCARDRIVVSVFIYCVFYSL